MSKDWTIEQKAKACAEILAQIAKGSSLRAVCEKGDDWIPPESTFRLWCDADNDLAAQYTRAREDRADLIFEECLEIADKQGADVVIADGMETVNHNVIARAKLQIDTRKWMLGKMQPKKYGEKLELSGNAESPLKVVTEIRRVIVRPNNDSN